MNTDDANDIGFDARRGRTPGERQAQVQVDATHEVAAVDQGHDSLLQYRLERLRGPANPSAMTILHEFPAFALELLALEAACDESTLQDEELYQRSLGGSDSIVDDLDASMLKDISLRRERDSGWHSRVLRALERRGAGLGPGVSDAEPTNLKLAPGASDAVPTRPLPRVSQRELNWPPPSERQLSTIIPSSLRDDVDYSRAQNAVVLAPRVVRPRHFSQGELKDPIDEEFEEKERSGDTNPKGVTRSEWVEAKSDLDSLSPNPRAITIASIAKPIANNEYLPNLEIVKQLPVMRSFSEPPATGNAAGVQPEPRSLSPRVNYPQATISSRRILVENIGLNESGGEITLESVWVRD